MILRYLSINLDRRDYPNAYGYELYCKSRLLCNFLEREILSKIKTKNLGYKQISINLMASPSEKPYITSQNVLVIELVFDKKEYDSLSGTELVDWFINVLINGIEQARKFKPPADALQNGVELLRRGNYVNRWLHKQKTYKSISLKSSLWFEITVSEFRAQLTLVKDKCVVYRGDILICEPNEYKFNVYVRDMRISDGQIIITGKMSEPFLILPIQKFV